MAGSGAIRVCASARVTASSLALAAMSGVAGQGVPAEQPEDEKPEAPTWCEVLQAAVDPAVVTDRAIREAIEKTGLPWRVRDRASGIEMLLVPPGEFVMGMSPEDQSLRCRDTPAHSVTLTQAFYLGRYEVTQQQYEAVTGGNPSKFRHPKASKSVSDLLQQGFTKEEAEKLIAKNPRKANPRGIEGPVEQVTWRDCMVFCVETDLRLPTEAEWEYACRAGRREPRYGMVDKIAWHKDNSGMKPHAVGTRAANALGFHDMLGNVWEWVNDWCADYPIDPQTDPAGPPSGDFRVIRGGSWSDDAASCRASYRLASYAASQIGNMGLRVARTP